MRSIEIKGVFNITFLKSLILRDFQLEAPSDVEIFNIKKFTIHKSAHVIFNIIMYTTPELIE